jgi:hypothetical protein
MKTWVICLAFLFLAVPLHNGAQQERGDETQTRGAVADHGKYLWYNGKAWGVLNSQSKTMYVDGIMEGMLLLLRETSARLSPTDRATLEAETTKKLMANGFRPGDVTAQIDSFYADSSNLRIPMADAYEYAMKKMHGSSARELEDYAAALRKTYNR